METDPNAKVDENKNSENSFDREAWISKKEILKRFDISARTLQRYRDDDKVGMIFYKGKYWYNRKDVEEAYKKKHKKTEKPAKLPLSIVWLSFWIAEAIMLLLPNNWYARLSTMVIPLTIAVPADIIIRIRKRRKQK